MPEGDCRIRLNIGRRYTKLFPVFMAGLLLAACASTSAPEVPDPLLSWNNGPSKQAILNFVSEVADDKGEHFVPMPERIAVFDNDGTLWAEKPIYFQFLFILERIHAMAPNHPDWLSTQPFQAVLESDFETLKATSRDKLAEMMAIAVSGTTSEEFAEIVSNWMLTARHPEHGRPISGMVYQPMLELLDYLEINGFTTYIVSGGGISFMRPWTERVYGIPPERVIGSSMTLEYEVLEGQPVITRKPALHFLNDKAGKPVSIQRFVGRRPILAVGNSDGDYEMLEWTTAGEGPRLGMLIHHTDDVREWAYDRHSDGGRLDRGLDSAAAKGWLLIDMAGDWKVVFPSDQEFK